MTTTTKAIILQIQLDKMLLMLLTTMTMIATAAAAAVATTTTTILLLLLLLRDCNYDYDYYNASLGGGLYSVGVFYLILLVCGHQLEGRARRHVRSSILQQTPKVDDVKKKDV